MRSMWDASRWGGLGKEDSLKICLKLGNCGQREVRY